jgi:predicted RNase H-like HicB family nuclease
MKTKSLMIALMLAAASGSVLAEGDATAPFDSAPTFSQAAAPGKTRAQVIAELKQARAEGMLSTGDYDYPKQRPFVSTKTRADVVAELKQAQAQGLANVSDADYPKLPQVASTKTRAQVQSELAQSRNGVTQQGLYNGA